MVVSAKSASNNCCRLLIKLAFVYDFCKGKIKFLSVIEIKYQRAGFVVFFCVVAITYVRACVCVCVCVCV